MTKNMVTFDTIKQVLDTPFWKQDRVVEVKHNGETQLLAESTSGIIRRRGWVSGAQHGYREFLFECLLAEHPEYKYTK